MSKPKFYTRVLQKGSRPFCLKTYQQCRGCFGWRNMLKAAQSDAAWQSLPFKCPLTGLTLKVESHAS
ncbi:MAG: hypothetical protein H8D87_07515 [Deltaproteobacteria bacterium]|uniref:hypothetical protein n=1 Tax=Desulfobacula sp. TaxID=2593537 RepID=UPI001984FC9B|nr:hypothetical protein [Candidatus Desulfobacula maris]MBL6993267.1 hypothetical protein [Desulfobacula sp.]